MNVPARGYSWEPFTPGHTKSLKHGATSARVLEPVVAKLRSELLEVAPWCTPVAFRPVVEAWSHAEAQAVLLRAYLDENGILDPATQEPRPAAGFLGSVEARADKLRQQLGLSPTSWAQLHRVLRDDPPGAPGGVSGLRALGRELIESTIDEAADGS